MHFKDLSYYLFFRMDLRKPWAKSDMVLMIEDQPLYVSRALLTLWSDPLDNLYVSRALLTLWSDPLDNLYVSRALLTLWSDQLDNLLNTTTFAQLGKDILHLPT